MKSKIYVLKTKYTYIPKNISAYDIFLKETDFKKTLLISYFIFIYNRT